MGDNSKYKIQIDCQGVVSIASMRGKKRYLMEKDFLDWLIGCRRPSDAPPWPDPDPNTDLYSLDREQMRIYAEFRRNLNRTMD